MVYWNIIMVCGEFDIIARYFNRQQQNRHDINIGIGDDCALITIPERQQLAITTDTLVAGIHFLDSISPEDLALAYLNSLITMKCNLLVAIQHEGQ